MTTPPTPTTNAPLWLQDMVSWIKSGGTQPMYDRAGSTQGVPNTQRGEGGVDLAAPIGTPVYALATGPLEAAQSFASQGFAHPGSVLAQRVNVPGVGLEDIYYQHIDLLPSIERCLGGNCNGVVIQKGQEIGTVGTAGETEVGFKAAGGGWGSLYGPSPSPGPWPSKPEPWIASLMGAGGPLTDGTYSGSTDSYNYTSSGSQCPWECALTPFASWGPCSGCAPQSTGNSQADQALKGVNNALQNTTDPGWWARVGVLVLGGILILVGAWKLMK